MRRIVVVVVLVLAACIWPYGQGVAAVQAAPAPGLQADFNNDGAADLAIGVPFEWVGAVQDAGAVHVLYGSAGGLQGPAPDPDRHPSAAQLSLGGRSQIPATRMFGHLVQTATLPEPCCCCIS